MHVFVTCKFKKDQTNSNQEKSRDIHFLDAQGQLTPVSGPIWPKIDLKQDIMHVHVTSNFKKDWIDSNQEKVETLIF